MSKRTLERLEELLDERDAEIEELKAELEKNEQQMDGDVWGWTRHIESKEAEGLPVPRLEMRWENMDPDGDGYNWRCRYDLVYRHFLGHVVKVPIGLTRSSGGKGRVTRGMVDTPFRDGCHIEERFGAPGAWSVTLNVSQQYSGPGEYPSGYLVTAEAKRTVESTTVRDGK